MVMVDTSVWAAFFRGEPALFIDELSLLLAGNNVATMPIIVAEVLQGFKSDADFEEAAGLLLDLPMVALSLETHLGAARLHRRLRSRGVTPRGTIDCLIAQACMEADVPLLTADRDFGAIARHPLRLHGGPAGAVHERAE